MSNNRFGTHNTGAVELVLYHTWPISGYLALYAI
jgi:hypothetical protein